MKNALPADIAEMKARGYDPSTIATAIAEAEQQSERLAAAQQRVIEAASAILRGELGVIEGSRLLCSFRFRVSSLDHDPDFLPFVAIDSETDHLPVGDVRQHWAADALASKDQEIQAAEAFYRDHALAGCERLLARFSSTSNDNSRNA
jgi:hypothetical protein